MTGYVDVDVVVGMLIVVDVVGCYCGWCGLLL